MRTPMALGGGLETNQCTPPIHHPVLTVSAVYSGRRAKLMKRPDRPPPKPNPVLTQIWHAHQSPHNNTYVSIYVFMCTLSRNMTPWRDMITYAGGGQRYHKAPYLENETKKFED